MVSTRARRTLAGAITIAAMAAGGAALGNAASSQGAGTTTTTTGSGSTSGSTMPAHGTAAHENAEKPVTGDAATKAKAAAVKAVGRSTAGDVTTDFHGEGYEVTVTKPDGSTVEIHLDSSFDVATHGRGGFGH